MSGDRTLVVHVLVPGNPKGKARPRTGFNLKTGKAFTRTPQSTIDAQNEIAWLVKIDLQERGLGGDPDPIGRYAVDLRLHELRGNGHQVDIDNVLKLVLDALNGVVWADDRQVVDAHPVMVDREAKSPRTEISIYRLGGA